MRIVHNDEAYAQLLRSPALAADLRRRAQNVADASGGEAEGYVARASASPRVRARAVVIAINGDPENNILRNLDAGRQ